MYSWRKGIAQWTIKDTLYLSVVFTWDLPEAKRIAEQWKKKVIAGGPAVSLMPDYMRDVATVERETAFPALAFHNPMATFTTRGCPNKCAFCAVPRTEGEFRELDRWEARPIVCDNNLLAATWAHFRKVVNSLKGLPFVDFNQGLDARLFTNYHARTLAELKRVKLRFAFDHVSQEKELVVAITRARRHGLTDLGVYVLIGHEDTPDDAFYRLERVRQLGVRPNPMRYRPLYLLEKDSYLPDGWISAFGSREKAELHIIKYMQYYSKLRYVEHVSFHEYRYREDEARQESLNI